MPRLPINVPRAATATISPVGVTRFCNGIGGPHAATAGPLDRPHAPSSRAAANAVDETAKSDLGPARLL
jgi:hypothetical protein